MPFDQYGNYTEDAPMFGDALLSQPTPPPPVPDAPLFPAPAPGPQMFLDQSEFAPAAPTPPEGAFSGLGNLAEQIGGGIADVGQDMYQNAGQFADGLVPPPPEPARPPTLEELAQPANIRVVQGTGSKAVQERGAQADQQLARDFARGQVVNQADTAMRVEGSELEKQRAIDADAEHKRFLAEMEKGQLEAKQEAATRMADIDREVAIYRNMHISQGAALKKLGPVGNAANALAMFGEGFMNARYGIKTGATAAINAWMDRDIEIQKAEVAKQGQVIGEYRNLYDMVRQNSKDEEEARTKFHMMKLTELDAENQIRQAGYQSKLAEHDGKKASVAITSQYENARLALANKISQDLSAAKAAEVKARQQARNAQNKAMALAAARQDFFNAEAILRNPSATPEDRDAAVRAQARAAGIDPALKLAAAAAGDQVKDANKRVAESTATPAVFGGYEVGAFKPDLTKEERADARQLGSDQAQFMSDLNDLQNIIDKNGGPNMLQGKLGSTDQAILRSKWQKAVSTRGHQVSGAAMSDKEFERIQEQVAGDPSFFSRASNAAVLHGFISGTIDGMDAKMTSYVDFHDKPIKTKSGSISPAMKAKNDAIVKPAGELSDNARQAASLGQRYAEGTPVSPEDAPTGLAPLLKAVGAKKPREVEGSPIPIPIADNSDFVYDDNLQTLRALGQRAANGDTEAITALRSVKGGTDAERQLRNVVIRYIEMSSGTPEADPTFDEKVSKASGTDFVSNVEDKAIRSLAVRHSDALRAWLSPDPGAE